MLLVGWFLFFCIAALRTISSTHSLWAESASAQLESRLKIEISALEKRGFFYIVPLFSTEVGLSSPSGKIWNKSVGTTGKTALQPRLLEATSNENMLQTAVTSLLCLHADDAP